jgi:hypothetical protein
MFVYGCKKDVCMWILNKVLFENIKKTENYQYSKKLPKNST